MIKQVNKYFCDFCGIDQDRAGAMVTADRGVAICDKCADEVMNIVSENREKARLAKESGDNLR